MPDFRAELLGWAEGDVLWTEWRWRGTRPDGTRFDQQGVIIYGLREDRIATGRLYMGPLPGVG
jgi:hypothetical protein